jgi:peptide/nickel transport system substrate-binding protein
MRSSTLAVTLAAAALSATPAFAQKSANTLRLALNAPFNVLSTYDLPIDEGGVFSRDVYDFLLSYDEHNKKYVPALAKSWKRIDDKTIEFELKPDIKFHNGNPVEASDVKATVDYITDPKSKITYQSRYTWVQDIEVLGPHKLRVVAKEPTGTDLATLAYRFQVWDGKVLNKMADRGDYARLNPIGSGPYKVTQLDTNKGIIVERYEGFNTIPDYKKAAIKRIHAIPIPDRQTQSAQMLVGAIDLLRNVPPDTAKALVENPNLKLTYVEAPDLFYLALDSAGLSGNKALTDVRVRKAMHMAIDRAEIIKHIVPGGEVAEHIEADCFKTTIACKYSVTPPKYDPEGAKKLLAEAGYPNGFDLVYHVFAPNKPIGEAVAGYLHKVGVRTSVQPVEIGLYRRLQGDGKLQAWSILFPTGSYPDAGNIFSVLFTGPAMQYYKDDIIADAMVKGEAEFDEAKRADIYKVAFDRINQMHYHLPISSIPTVFVHSKDVKVNPGKLSAGVTYATDFAWN